jgi:rhodanese-related sulfurtransferase
MAEFSITFCANWRHNGRMIAARPHLLAAAALLALTACGGERDGKDEPHAAPLGFELAMARVSSADTAAPNAPAVADLTPEELAARLKAGNVRLIDVRTDAEVAEGTIPGAEHIPLDQFDPASLDLSDGREVVLYCRSGRRSAIAGAKLAAATGQAAEHLAGGIIAWEAAGQPIKAPR